MALTPVQQVLQTSRAQRKRPPKFGPYKVAGSAKRTTERQLSALVREFVSDIEARVLTLVPETPTETARTDTAPLTLTDIQVLLRPLTDKYVRRISPQAERMLSAAEREQLAAEKRVVSPLGLDVVGGESWLRKKIQIRSREFTDLITKMARDTELRIGHLALESLQTGRSRTWLRKQIQEVAGIGERRAKLIARDQVGKLQGALHEARQKDLGIESYIWRTSRDERVAGNPGGLYPDAKSNDPFHGNHWEREGWRFLWKKSGGRLVEVLKDGSTRVTDYVDGHPGEPGICRCSAEPVITGLEDLQELGREAPVASRYKVR